MNTLSRTELYSQSSADVFTAIDDLGVTGMLMTESSMMMMRGKLKIQFLTTNNTGLGSRYRWTGKMMGFTMDFTVEVTKWIAGKEKVWETIGPAKLIIYSWYRMNLVVRDAGPDTEAELS